MFHKDVQVDGDLGQSHDSGCGSMLKEKLINLRHERKRAIERIDLLLIGWGIL